ncbi:MAG: S49 family peptidase [Gammaproteobacteria bacterium]|nr:S49 family peptidase [Gammaproteobacteria bacterium]
MSDKKPGMLRRLLRFLGSLVRIARTVLSTLLLLIFIAMLASLFGGELKPLPEHALLRIAPTGTLVEQRSYADPRELLGPGGGPAPETRVADLVEAIGAAATDPRITGIALELDELAGGGLDKLETVGQALAAFRAGGKPVIAIGDSYTQSQYYLASFADEIHLNPFGNVLLTGLGSYHLYFKEALDKLRINFMCSGSALTRMRSSPSSAPECRMPRGNTLAPGWRSSGTRSPPESRGAATWRLAPSTTMWIMRTPNSPRPMAMARNWRGNPVSSITSAPVPKYWCGCGRSPARVATSAITAMWNCVNTWLTSTCARPQTLDGRKSVCSSPAG